MWLFISVGEVLEGTAGGEHLFDDSARGAPVTTRVHVGKSGLKQWHSKITSLRDIVDIPLVILLDSGISKYQTE